MCGLAAASALAGQAEVGRGLTIEVLEGSGALVNIRDRGIPAPRVRVLDASGQAVEGAAVTFRLPDAGPSARFDDGRILTLTSDAQGEASTPKRLRPNLQVGAWEIRVSAAYKGAVARASIPMTNAAPVEAFEAKKRGGAMYWVAAVAAGVAAAATVGVARGAAGQGVRPGAAGVATPASSSSGATPALSITPGGATFSAP